MGKKAMQSVTLEIPTILTLPGHPAPVASESPDGFSVITFTCDSPEAAIKTAKAASRELIKFHLDKDVHGERKEKAVSFTFGVAGAELPLTWRGRKGRPAKPEMLKEIQEALKGYKTTYFNSSVNEGITVADERIPCGLQYVYDNETDEAPARLTAKVLKSAQVGGGKTWTDKPLESADQALALVERLEEMFTDL